MSDPAAGGRGGRRPRGQAAVVGIVLAAALVAALAFLLVRGTQESSSAIDVVKDATGTTLARYRAQAKDAGGGLTVTWSVSPMSGGQMVEARIQSSLPEYRGKAVFMVDSDGTRIVAQDRYAASLLGPRTQPKLHR
jgi:hypothetical protein